MINIDELIIYDEVKVLSNRQLVAFREFLNIYLNEPHDEFDMI